MCSTSVQRRIFQLSKKCELHAVGHVLCSVIFFSHLQWPNITCIITTHPLYVGTLVSRSEKVRQIIVYFKQAWIYLLLFLNFVFQISKIHVPSFRRIRHCGDQYWLMISYNVSHIFWPIDIIESCAQVLIYINHIFLCCPLFV